MPQSDGQGRFYIKGFGRLRPGEPVRFADDSPTVAASSALRWRNQGGRLTARISQPKIALPEEAPMMRHGPHPRVANVILLAFICLAILGLTRGQQVGSAIALIKEFRTNRVFWKQFEIAGMLVKLHDTSVLRQLRPCLKDDDRHVRGNAAYIFAALGDDAGFEVLRGILSDRSERPEGQGIPGGGWALKAQISADRYYAVHLLCDLKDARAVAILVPLLHVAEVDYIVPWALGEIGEKASVPPILQMLTDKNPDLRVLAIDALETLRAKEALPRLRLLLHDEERIHFDGLGTVAEAAREGIAKLEAVP